MDLDKLSARRHSTEQRRADAHEALAHIVHAIRSHPTTGQAGRLVRFLAGLYNSSDYPFELTDLRGLDRRLQDACLTYLEYDVLGEKEVHNYIPGGAMQLNQWIVDYGLRPAEPTLQRFAKVEERQRERGVYAHGSLVTYGNAPGYRDVTLTFDLQPLGEEATLRVEVRVSAEDAMTVLRHIVDVNRTAWSGGKRPIDAAEVEKRPAWLDRL